MCAGNALLGEREARAGARSECAGGPAGYRGEASSSPSLQPPPPQQQQGHAIQPVWLRQPSLPWDLGAGAPPIGFGLRDLEEMRKMVLDGFKHCAHGIMENSQGHAARSRFLYCSFL